MPAAVKAPKKYVSILLGEQKQLVNKVLTTRKIYSRVDEKVATKLGVKGEPGGVKTKHTVKKGKATGAIYYSYPTGVRGGGYKLGFSRTGNEKNNYSFVNIPVPVGTPMIVIAKFAASLKVKPKKIVSPKGEVYYATAVAGQ